MNPEYYELRYIERSSAQRDNHSLLGDNEDKLTLLDLIESNNHILLLGNPGIGKTTELLKTFEKLWATKNDTSLVPLYLNIKSFRQTSTIEDLIQFDSWKKKSSVVFFFDGLDEIGNIQDFVSELTNFMSKYSNLSLKFVISCRTNIYQKYLINIPKFTTAYLMNLSYAQIESILLNKFDLQVAAEELEKHSTILQTPFNLDLFALYHIENGRYPERISEAWELAMTKQVENTHEKLGRRFIHLTKAEISNALEEVAITNELMQQNEITENNLFKLLGSNGIALFQELPFTKIVDTTDSYTFIHKNYQEYFAAKKIAEWNPDTIIQFIKADDLDKVRPNLFNTLTFLLSILKEKFEPVKNWLFENDIEILFFTDDNRLDEPVKHKIFAEYFNEICIEKSFWIDSNAKISIETLAKFAEFSFLLSHLDNKKNPRRVRGSALEVLSKKRLTELQKSIVLDKFLLILNEQDDQLTTEVLRAIKFQNFHKDPTYLNLVLDIVKSAETKDIYHQMIAILGDLEDEERDNDLFIDTIKKYYSIYDTTIRGTEFIVASTILKTEDPNLNLSLVDLLFDEKYTLRSNSIFFDNFESRLLERIKKFSSDLEYRKKLGEIVFAGHRIMSSQLLQSVLLNVELTADIILHVIQKSNASRDILYNISGFLNEGSINAIVENYKSESSYFNSPENIESLRNWVANNNDYKLGLYLERKLSEVGFIFSKSLKPEDKILAQKKEYEEFQLRNFELLFDKTELLKEIQKYFETYKVESLSNMEFQPLFWKWYDDLGYHGIQYTVHTAIETALRHFSSVTVGKIAELLENSYFYLSLIKTSLNHNSLKQFSLQSEHFAIIQYFSQDLAKEIDFTDVILPYPESPERFRTTFNFSYLKLVLYFDTNFDIKQNKEFYLNAAELGNIGAYQFKDGGSFIDFIAGRINDKAAVDERITASINMDKLNVFSKEEFIDYALDQNLTDTFDKIGAIILSENNFISREHILEKYVSKLENPLTFLKKCCTNPNSHFYWQVIKLIKVRNDNEFILEAALNYLKTEDMQFMDDAINILFYLNHENALQVYLNALNRIIETEKDSSGFMPKDIENYKNVEELHLFENLFDLIYTPSTYGSFYLYQSRKLMSYLTASLSQIDYEKLTSILIEIKSNLEKLDDSEEIDHKTFYINELIDISFNSHLKLKSERLTFEEAFEILKR